MLDPIKARFASSFSKKGIIDADTPTIWLGATSIYSISDGPNTGKSPCSLHLILSVMKAPCSFKGAFACATFAKSSPSADKYLGSTA